MLMTLQWCNTRSRMSDAMVRSANTSFHCEKILFEVKIDLYHFQDRDQLSDWAETYVYSKYTLLLPNKEQLIKQVEYVLAQDEDDLIAEREESALFSNEDSQDGQG